MFSWFDRLFPKKKKSSCCSKNTCGTNNIWNKPQASDDTVECLTNTMVVNTIANSICMDQGHPMCCPSEDSNTTCCSGSSCCSNTVSDSPMPDYSPSCCNSDCSVSCDSGSSCCDSGCGSSD